MSASPDQQQASKGAQDTGKPPTHGQTPENAPSGLTGPPLSALKRPGQHLDGGLDGSTIRHPAEAQRSGNGPGHASGPSSGNLMPPDRPALQVEDDHADMQAQHTARDYMRIIQVDRQTRELSDHIGVVAALDHMRNTARPRRLARSLRDQGMSPAEARDALMARLGLSRASAYRLLSSV